MATIVTRSGKGSALTHTEMDSNFTNINNELAGAGGSPSIDDNGDATAITIDINENVGVGTSTMNSNKAVIEGGSAETLGSSLALKTGSGTTSKSADLAFYSTFYNNADTGQRRTADITAGFSTGVWGTEYLAFGVGSSGDSAYVASEKLRINSNGKITTGSNPINEVEINKDTNTADVIIGTSNVSATGQENGFNCGVGSGALGSVTNNTAHAQEGKHNTGMGSDALGSCTTGYWNTGNGGLALSTLTTGTHNIANGTLAMWFTTTGIRNVGNGTQALWSNTTGYNNLGDGYEALGGNTTGHSNTGAGCFAGKGNTTGTNNTFLGYNAGTASSPSGNVTTGSNTVCIGDNSVANLYCADTTISSSDARDKTDVEDFSHGLDFINQLNPVTYKWDKRAWYIKDDDTAEDLLNAKPDGSQKREKKHLGFLAQDVETIEKTLGFSTSKDDQLVVHTNEDDTAMGIKYERLVPVLVNAIKELSAEIELLKGGK